MDIPSIKSSKTEQTVDLAQLIVGLAKVESREQEISNLLRFLNTVATQEVELLNAISPVLQEIVKVVPPFYSERIEVHRRSLRVAKLFSFRPWADIEKEASKRAWEDTMAMLPGISISESPMVAKIVDGRSALLELVGRELSRLLQQGDNHWVREVGLDHIRSLIAGQIEVTGGQEP